MALKNQCTLHFVAYGKIIDLLTYDAKRMEFIIVLKSTNPESK